MHAMDFRSDFRRLCLRPLFAKSAPLTVSIGALSPALAQAQDISALWQERPISFLLALALGLIALVMLVYGVRQTLFSVQRMWGAQRYPYAGIEQAQWPQVTVFIAAHNEEKVIADSMRSLLQTDYPADRIKVVVVNDRSTDRTAAIVDAQVQAHPDRLVAFHRTSGKPGKAAALKDAMCHAVGDIALIFDADYTPGPGLVRQLVAPFLDPEVGAVMGRVVPRNVSTNLLTRMLDMERAAGYQVDQQARMNLRAVPQYGGTVGGVRISAVQAVGGWRDDVLAEDTDITIRLLIGGWKTVYNNEAACYEEVPEEWSVRLRQVHRWAKGHNQVLLRHAPDGVADDLLACGVVGAVGLFPVAVPDEDDLGEIAHDRSTVVGDGAAGRDDGSGCGCLGELGCAVAQKGVLQIDLWRQLVVDLLLGIAIGAMHRVGWVVCGVFSLGG